MRTIITVNRQIMEQLRKRAAQSGGPVRRLIKKAVRFFQQAPATGTPEEPFELVTFGAGGRFSEHSPDKTSALLEAEDVERFGRRR